MDFISSNQNKIHMDKVEINSGPDSKIFKGNKNHVQNSCVLLFRY